MQNYSLNSSLNEEEEISELSSYCSDELKSEIIDEFLQKIRNETDYSIIDSDLVETDPKRNVIANTNTLNFDVTFPGVFVQKDIRIENVGDSHESFDVFIQGSDFFESRMSKIELDPGEKHSLAIFFKPKAVSSFAGKVILQGYVSLVVELIGYCMKSPLEIPENESSIWCFSNKPEVRMVPLSNNSPTKTLNVEIGIYSSLISSECSSMVISPNTTKYVSLSFNPAINMHSMDSYMKVRCNETGDNLRFDFRFPKPKQRTIINFGDVIVGRKKEEVVAYAHFPNIDIQTPFSVVSKNEHNVVLLFEAFSPGYYSKLFNLESNYIELIGNAVQKPFLIDVPSKFPRRPFIITNVAQEVIRFSLRTNNERSVLSHSDFELSSGGSIEVSMLISDQKNDLCIYISWKDTNGKIFTDIFEFNNEISNNSRSLLEASTILQVNPEIIDSKNDALLSPDFLFFPGVEKHGFKYGMITINKNSDFEIKSPDWIKSEIIEGNPKQLSIYCQPPISPTIDFIDIIFNKNSSKRIPVFAYSLSSSLIFEDTYSFNGNSGSLVVTNNGENTAFVALFDNSINSIIHVLPQSAIIEPSKQIQFSINTDNDDESCHQLSIVFGDLIILSMWTYYKPNDPFSLLFADSTMSSTKPPFHLLTKKQASSIISESVFTKNIDVSFFGNKGVLFDPPSLLFQDNNREHQISITNNSINSVKYRFEDLKNLIISKPMKGRIRAKSAVNVSIVLISYKEKFSIPIWIDNQKYLINVSKNEPTIPFYLSSDVLDFGKCRLGSNKERNLEIHNQSFELITLALVFDKNIIETNDSVQVEPNSSKVCSICWKPNVVGECTSRLLIRFKSFEKEVKLNCFVISQQPESKIIDFPSCEVGAKKMIRIKVGNVSNFEQKLQIKISKPFACSHKLFSINPKSYVMVPFVFNPTSIGYFHHDAEILMDSMVILKLKMSGHSYSYN